MGDGTIFRLARGGGGGIGWVGWLVGGGAQPSRGSWASCDFDLRWQTTKFLRNLDRLCIQRHSFECRYTLTERALFNYAFVLKKSFI